MRRNKLGYLGFLGLLGLLGLVNGNYWALGFFGYFGFFGMLRSSTNDERNQINLNRACKNAFALDTVVAILSFAYVMSVSSMAFNAMPLFVALLSQGVTIFGLSYAYYARKGD
jgi:hypothetical protein